MEDNRHYAKNSKGELVHIDAVPNGSECNCFCLACNDALVAKNNGQKKEHHFAHQSNSTCSGEAYLHRLAKERIRKAFLESKEFYIKYTHRSYCPKSKDCKFLRADEGSTKYCFKSVEEKEFDLKKYYDDCEQESSYGGEVNFRSDLKIYSKQEPDRDPVYIEILVTHASEEEKLHSGARIIEIKIKNEQDIDHILAEGGFEECSDEYGDFCSFHGFGDYKNNEISQEISFIRYWRFSTGKYSCRNDYCQCNKLKREGRKSTLREICYHTDDKKLVWDYVMWKNFKKNGFKSCWMCEFYVDGYDRNGKMCCLYKKLEIDMRPDIATANQCREFKCNYKEEEINEVLSRVEKLDKTVLLDKTKDVLSNSLPQKHRTICHKNTE